MTLKAGVRDENGLESIDGIFSSPEKSPAKSNGLNQISTISEGESMDIGQSEQFFWLSSKAVLLNEWLIRHFVAGTNLDPTEVIGRARNGRNILPPRSRSPIKTNIGSSPRRSLGPVSSPSRVVNGATPNRTMSHPPESSTLDMLRGELTPSIEGSDQKGRKSDLKNVKKLPLNGKGKKRVFDLSMASDSDEDERSSIVINDANETNVGGFDDNVAQEESLGAAAVEDQGEEDERTSIVINDAQEESSGAAAAEDQGEEDASSEKHKDPKKGISERDPNAKMKPPPRPTTRTSLRKPKRTKTESGKPKLTSLFAIRSETPGDDNGALRMKSGRTSIKPVAFWRNERIIYGDGNIEGKVLTLPSIKEVIRTDEIEVKRPKRYYNRRPKPRRQIKDESEEEEDERAPWETGPGTVRAQVMQWDPAIGKYDEENTEEIGERSRLASIADEPH